MFKSFHSAVLIVAALSATSVAPAKTGPNLEPLVSLASADIPEVVKPQPLVIEETPSTVDIPAPVQQAEPVQPVVRPSGNLTSMVSQLRSSNPGSRELECLAVGIYFESKSEPLAGQLAVGKVIANRANSHGRFPSSYCGVLFQRSQFSFIRGRSLPNVPRSSKQWQTAVAVAKIVDGDLQDSAAENALFFHARRVSPGWRLKQVAAIGNHLFFR
jgi:spore germination cell wall hydrolase CwlJ-like protein